MIIGYEECRSCGWRNIFWEGEEPKAQLIAGLELRTSFICPECRGTACQRASFGGPVPYSTLFHDQPPAPPLSKRQQLRAVVRWIGPHEAEGQDFAVLFTAIFVLTVTYGLLFDHQIIGGFLRAYWWGIRVFLVWRLVISLAVVGMVAPGGKSGLYQAWTSWVRASSVKPLFQGLKVVRDRHRRRRTGVAWLRSQGMSRAEARKIARY